MKLELPDTGAESSASVETSKETENATTKTPETKTFHKVNDTNYKCCLTKAPETTKASETTPPHTKLPTAHTHAWVPVTKKGSS